MEVDTKYWLWLAGSLVIAYSGWWIPQGAPLAYDAMITRSLPLGIAWSLAFAFCLWRYKKRGLWLLLGAPMALYWPVWLLFNHFPPCYYTHSCV